MSEGEEEGEGAAAAMALGVEIEMRTEDINKTEGNETIEGDIFLFCFGCMSMF